MSRTFECLGLALAVLGAGCATLTNKSAHHISVVSDVPADCVLTDSLGPRRFQAPGIVYAEPKHGPVNLRCETDGYKPFSTTVDTELNDMVLGNILLGGLIGLAIDAGQGNTKRYPDEVHIFMEPAAFATEAERESWLEERAAKLRELEQRANKR